MFSHLDRAVGAGVGVAFTNREGGVTPGVMGSLNLGRTDVDEVAHTRRNGELVCRALGVERLVAVHQVHGADVLVADREFLQGWGADDWLGADAGQAPLPVADAIITDQPDVALMVRVADCVPVLLACAQSGIIGAAHAGRVGFDAGVLGATVEAMRTLGATGTLRAWIGPHVCGGCYEVPQRMADDVDSRHPGVASTTSWGTPSLDLGQGCRRQLEELGTAVVRVDPCTFESADLHSHRRDSVRSGRLAGLVWRSAR